ncbi:MAG TPA: BTAD domain-containing putative transcriptional regulator [Jiangellaceae bacterium]
MRIAVLGPLHVVNDDLEQVVVAGSKERLLLAALAAAAPDALSVDRLVDTLWKGRGPPTARKSLQAHVVRLRTALEPDRPTESTGRYVLRRGGGYVLAVNPDELDALAFPDLVARGRALLSGGDAAATREQLANTLALWRGEPYEDWPSEPFAETERRRLAEIRASAEEALFDANLALGRPGEVIAKLERLVIEDPLREGWWIRLMLALYRDSRQGEALAAATRARAVLAEELGVDPGPQLRALEAAVLAQDPALYLPGSDRIGTAARPQPEPPAGRAATCPYKGLASYQSDDAAVFCGRARLVTALVARLIDTDVLVLSGPSGAGKSSVVRAGLTPTLAADAIPGSSRWPLIVITPSSHPVDALAPFTAETEDRSENGPARPALLVIDQAEQLWAGHVDPAERRAFLSELLNLVDDGITARVILVIRGDHLARLAEHAAFAERVAGALVLVPPLTADELREVVIKPAHAVGLDVEPELADAVVADVLGRPGALPLLSTALVATWERRRGDLLTLSGYLEAGAVSGALGRSAETAFERLDSTGQAEARRILVRLADSAEGGALVSRSVSLAELDLDGPGGAEQRSVVETFVARRLLAVDEGRLEVAHEALLTAWPRLAGWLDDDAVGRRVRRHLAPAAQEWDGRGRPDEELYRGARLTSALEWADTPAAVLTTTENEFLQASKRRGEAELQDARDRADHEGRARRRTRRFAIGLAAALAFALVAAAVALQAREMAQDRTVEAATARTVAEANRLAALSASAGTIDLSLLLAAEAVRVADTPETRDGLLGTLVEHARAVRVLPIYGRPREMALAGDGRTVFLSTDDGVFTVDLVTDDGPRQILGRAPHESWPLIATAPEEALVAVSVKPTGFRLDYPLLQVMDANGDVRQSFDETQLGGKPFDLTFNRDGNRVVVVVDRELVPGDDSTHGYVMGVVEIELSAGVVRDTGIEVRSPSPGETILDAALSADGSRVAIWPVEPASTVTVADLADGRRVEVSGVDRPGQNSMGFAPLPFGLVQRWEDGVLVLYDADGNVAQTVAAHEGKIFAVAGTSDGRTAVSVGEDGGVVVWDAIPATGEVGPSLSKADVMTGHDGSVTGVALPANGQTMLTGGMDGRLVEWDLSGNRGFARPVEPIAGRVISNRPHSIGDTGIVVAPTRPRLRLTDVLGVPAGDDTAVSATFLNAKTGQVIDHVPVGDTIILSPFGSSVSTSPDGKRIAVTTAFRTTLVDAASHEVLATIELPPLATDDLPTEPVWGSGWSADGSRLYLAADGTLLDGDESDGAVVVVSGDTLEIVGRIAEGRDSQLVEISPDGRWLAVGREFTGDIVVLDESDHAVTVAELSPPLPDPLVDMSFSPDGRWLAAGGYAGRLSIWSTADWSVVREAVPLHSDRMLQVEWLPDSSTVVTSGEDGRVVLYDAERGIVRGRPLSATADGQRGRAYIVPDLSSELIVLAGALPGRAYPLEPEKWFFHACAVAGRDLTEAEWETYVPDRPYRRTCGL